MQTTSVPSVKDIYEVLETVKDPEIPVISVVDLGIIRDVRIADDKIEIDISPTYSGCPALDVIPILIREAVEEAGLGDALVRNVLSPPWTTDWISEKGKEQLRIFGIAPPVGKRDPINLEDKQVPCPKCGSLSTKLISRFGSTPCKAAYQCSDCLEPFDYFKCH